VEQFRLHSPDGQYTAVISTPRLWQLLPRLPGQAGDKPGQVEMLDQHMQSLGRMPLSRVSLASDLEWIRFGARIRLVGAWNFRDRFYAYWNDDQTHMITQQLN